LPPSVEGRPAETADAVELDALPQAATIVDADGTVLAANGEVGALGVGELVGRSLLDLLDEPEPVRAGLAASGGGAWAAETVGRRADGVPFPLDVAGRPLGDGRSLLLLRDRNADGSLVSLAERHFEAAFESSPIGMALYDTDGRFVRVNEAMCQLLGRPQEQLIGIRDQELTHPADRDADLDAAARVLAGELATFQTEKRFVAPDGTPVWVIANLTFLRDHHGRPISWLGQFQDVTEHRRLAEHDPLTGLCNRRRFGDALEELLRHGARYGPAGSLLLFDLDGLKQVNDRFGHAAGDTVLLEVARAVQERTRETDVLARLGGDEFSILLPHRGEDGAVPLARDLAELVASLRFDFDPEARVTASIGIASLDPEAGADAVLTAADRALYEAKHAGGDGWRLAR
jgi:diguanylate cyclase (GGDEF)-like protein/PAS domain S-box-containing protein